MNPFALLRKAFQRYRHSRGFGVHSPYAFQFVNDVVKPGDYGYYAYDALDDFPALPPRATRDIRWFVRLSVFLKTKRIIVFQAEFPEIKITSEILGLDFTTLPAVSEMSSGPEDLFIVEDSFISEDTVEKVIKNHTPVLALNPGKKLREILCKERNRGLLLTGKRRILYIPRESMAFTAYDIKI